MCAGDTYSGVFDISKGEGDSFGLIKDIDGFQPGADNAFFGTVTFAFGDDRDKKQKEKAEIALENVTQGRQIGRFTLKFNFLNPSELDSINDNGQLAYEITAKQGDYWLKSGNLFVIAET